MAGNILVRQENGRYHGISQNIHDMTRKNHIEIFFKVGAKMAKIVSPNFFLTYRKTKNPRLKKFRYIEFMETFNI